uniref:B box-type domain-containing protein n=1 Tax=Callorhinchus milii TaxID=7868 RepID=A0A4W3JNW2_CALMI
MSKALELQMCPWLNRFFHYVLYSLMLNRKCLNIGVALCNAHSSVSFPGVIYCPVCRQQCYTSDIIENYFMRDGVELDSASNNKASQVVCTSCEDNAMASSFCVECVEWLCDACVEAHQRVKFTKDHTMSAKNPGLLDGKTACERPVFCSIHKQEPLKLFCETCDTLTCRDCQLLTHKDHRYQFLEEAIQNHKMTLENLVTRLTEKKSQLQATTKQVRTRLRDVQEMQKKVQVEIKMAILQIMKELNKRGKTLIQRVEKLAEEQQMKLEQQHLSMSKLHRQMDHALRFASWAINSDNTTALLLCKKLVRAHSIITGSSFTGLLAAEAISLSFLRPLYPLLIQSRTQVNQPSGLVPA